MGSPPHAAIVVLGGASFGAPLDAAVVKGEGVAYINYDPYAVGKEGTPRNNKQGAFYDIYGSNSTTGLLVAWAWGVSRIIDVIEQSDGSILKASAVGVTGCSRFGKGAFVIGVFDQRIALTMPINRVAPAFRSCAGFRGKEPKVCPAPMASNLGSATHLGRSPAAPPSCPWIPLKWWRWLRRVDSSS